MTRAAPLPWGAFLAAGLLAAVGGATAQFAFAALAIGVLGLPHGAADLAEVPAAERPGFLLVYLAAMAAVVLLWRGSPAAGLAALLLLAAAHFAVDGRAEQSPPVRAAVGVLLVAGPALLHGPALALLFEEVTRSAAVAAGLAAALRLAGVAAAVALAAALVTAPASRPALGLLDGVGLLALVLLPPLVGFAIGFVLLHARHQTAERQRALGCPTLRAYLRRTAPVLAGAAVSLGAIALLSPRAGPGLLFLAIAALATPHMIVPALWRRAGAALPAAAA